MNNRVEIEIKFKKIVYVHLQCGTLLQASRTLVVELYNVRT